MKKVIWKSVGIFSLIAVGFLVGFAWPLVDGGVRVSSASGEAATLAELVESWAAVPAISEVILRIQKGDENPYASSAGKVTRKDGDRTNLTYADVPPHLEESKGVLDSIQRQVAGKFGDDDGDGKYMDTISRGETIIALHVVLDDMMRTDGLSLAELPLNKYYVAFGDLKGQVVVYFNIRGDHKHLVGLSDGEGSLIDRMTNYPYIVYRVDLETMRVIGKARMPF